MFYNEVQHLSDRIVFIKKTTNQKGADIEQPILNYLTKKGSIFTVLCVGVNL